MLLLLLRHEGKGKMGLGLDWPPPGARSTLPGAAQRKIERDGRIKGIEALLPY